eukprot:CAMPEP_0116034296 /NCGR_PEP_ID=MMETSP0321-20121206/19521_1 /TAXON_ID=163516 /ORGANISM="Leptocylindrus danicus var. danicus, Strain B650" /LENGTH=359 /DNA_ID=CAMNT_0003510577 /DNA_START=17 /DNA_END=1096 /DNA_ORIENTATION=-
MASPTSVMPNIANLSQTSEKKTGGAEVVTEGKVEICRFLIKDINSDEAGHLLSSLYIDLIRSQHGLYDLVSTVFDVLNDKGLSSDSVYSHLWSLKLAGFTYQYGWRFCGGKTTQNSVKPNTLDEAEPRIISTLAIPLADGQKGRFIGSNIQFSIVVKSAALEEIDPTTTAQNEMERMRSLYPRVTEVPNEISADIFQQDWITAAEMGLCENLRSHFEIFTRGKNSWKPIGRDLIGYEPCKTKHPEWNLGRENEIIGLLMNAGYKFKKSWNNILKFAFINRSEGATSYHWHRLRNEDYFEIEHYGRNLSNERKIITAKVLAQKRMRSFLGSDLPKRDPHPSDKRSAKRWFDPWYNKWRFN